MEITTKGAVALRNLRQQWQEEAGSSFPTSVLRELLVLHDVCKCLSLNVFQVKEILGERGWQGITEYLRSSSCDDVNWKRVSALGYGKPKS